MTTPTDAELIESLGVIASYEASEDHPLTASCLRTAADRLAALLEENERLSLIIGSQAKKMHRWKPALEVYADAKNWGPLTSGREVVWTGNKQSGNGYTIARDALMESSREALKETND